MKNDALGEGLLQQGAFVLGEGLLQEEPFVLDVGYTTEVSCMSFGKGCEGLAEDSIETLVDFSSNECEIDISPFPGERDELLLQNKELACRMEELGVENETLRCKIRELEEEVSKLRSQTGNTPLPTLYVQLNTLRKEIAELEKRNQDLETENAELNIRLDKKGTETVCSEAESKPVRDSVRIPKPFKPTSFSRSASEPVDSVLTPKLKKQCSMRSESFEAAKLDFAEKLVKKEEMIQKLRKERDDCVNQVNELSAGIDGLETRFDLQLSTYQTEVMQKFENLIKSFKSIREREEEVDRTVGWFQNELSRMQKTFPDEIQRLSQSCQTLREEKDQEKEELEELLQHRTRNLEEAKKQIVSLSDEIKHQTEFVNELENTIDGLESKIASMKTQRLVSDGMHTVTSFKETDNLRERVVQLEEELAELRMTNETLLKEKDEAQEALFSPTQAKEAKGIEDLNKENEELRNELLEVSEKLVAMEEQNDSLKEEIENQSDFFGQCLNLEEELEAQRRMNRGLEEQLNRRKKRIASLQAELGHLKQQLVDMESGFGSRKRSKETKTAVSSHVSEVLQHERRYEELEKILNGVQDERDSLLQDKASLNKMMHSLVKENKLATRALNKLKNEAPVMNEALEEARAEITKLKARLKVESFARQHSGKSHTSSEAEDDIMSKLVASQIALAEMDERMIKLRKELHRSVARNMYWATKINRLEKQLQAA